MNIKKKLAVIARPLDKEHSEIDLPYEGCLPLDISGNYYRNGPNQKYLPQAYHHLVDGHGMLHQFSIHNGKIIYSNRWIKTKIYNIEEKYSQGMVGGFLKPFESDPRVKHFSSRERTKANTHVVQMQDTIYAFEEGGIPYLLSEHGLSTKHALKDALHLKSTVTGHPKYDFFERKLYCLNWNGESEYPACTFFWIDESGKCHDFRVIDIPYRALIHDFAITEHYLIIPLFPCVVDYSKARRDPNQTPTSWQPELGAYIGVIEKTTGQVLMWFDVNTFYALHTCNAYEEGSSIILDLVAHDTPPILVDEEHLSGDTNIRSQLMRVHLDLATKSSQLYCLDNEEFLYNFPRINDTNLGRRHDKIFACMTKNSSRNGMLYNEFLVAFDAQTLQKNIFQYEADWFFHEPIIIPRQLHAKERADLLLVLVSNDKMDISRLLLFDSDSIGSGPIMTANLPHMIPYGFHGCWHAKENN